MYKKFCDRCGKEITEDMKPECWYEVVKYGDYGNTNQTIDLCNGCLSEFERFLSGESLIGRTDDPLYDPIFRR